MLLTSLANRNPVVLVNPVALNWNASAHMLTAVFRKFTKAQSSEKGGVMRGAEHPHVASVTVLNS